MELLSRAHLQGWLEGYLLTGRHGLFSCYEAFVHIVDSMFNQHAKWLKTINRLEWRRPIPSLNYLLTSHVWRQDHNGFSPPGSRVHRPRGEQEGRGGPGLPAAGREHPAVHDGPLPADPELRQRGGGRQAAGAEWLDGSRPRCTALAALGVWEWAGNDDGDPDVVLACAGDVPTLETLAAVDLLRDLPGAAGAGGERGRPDAAAAESEHPHGMSDAEFDALFTTDKPVIFAYHGYPG